MKRSSIQYARFLKAFLIPQWFKILILAVVLFSGIGLQIINPQILRNFIDSVTQKKDQSALMMTAVLFFGFALVTQVISIVQAYLSEDIGWTATNLLRADLARHCLQLDLSFHTSRTPGELIERIDGDVAMLTNFFSTFILKLFGNAVLLMGVLAVLAHENWQLGLVLTVYAIVVIFVLYFLRDAATPYWETFREASANLYSYLEECLLNIPVIRTSGAGELVMNRLYKLMRRLLQTEQKGALMGVFPLSVSIMFFAAGNALGLGLGAWLYISGSVTLGTVYLIYYYTQLLSTPLQEIADQFQNFQGAQAGLGRIQELYRIPSKLQDGNCSELPHHALSVRFQNVSFAYQTDSMVLQDVSFDLPNKKVLGILGRTGSGKSTLARLLFRLYDPCAGAILLDQVDIRTMHLADLRQHIGLVTQEVQLFHASIRDNLTFFDNQISDEQILQVLHDLGLSEWYTSLPEGLNTLMNTNGYGLSAGQAQLLACARVFLKNPGVVILDEASSRLDPASERLLEKAIDKLFQNRTGIIIAHRLATIQRADDILILKDGKIREYASRQSLIESHHSFFYRLINSEVLEEELA